MPIQFCRVNANFHPCYSYVVTVAQLATSDSWNFCSYSQQSFGCVINDTRKSIQNASVDPYRVSRNKGSCIYDALMRDRRERETFKGSLEMITRPPRTELIVTMITTIRFLAFTSDLSRLHLCRVPKANLVGTWGCAICVPPFVGAVVQ